MAGPEVCLSCSAAARDAMDLLELQMQLDGDTAVMIKGMDRERLVKVLLYMGGFAGALVDMTAVLMGESVEHVLAIIREETERERHEH